jgi:hypothetical protein
MLAAAAVSKVEHHRALTLLEPNRDEHSTQSGTDAQVDSDPGLGSAQSGCLSPAGTGAQVKLE